MIDTVGLRKKYSPEGSSLRKHQLLLLEEMQVLDRICKEHGLTYFLTDGSALGAVRHQGFIPWDDDLDIALFEDDYKKLVKILLETESDKYILHCRQTDFNYTFGFPKYRAKEGNLLGCFPARGKLYKYRGYGIDIFCVSSHSYIRVWTCAKARAALLNWMYKLKNDKVRRVVTKFNWFIYDCFQPLTFPLDLFKKKGELHYGLGKGWPCRDIKRSEVLPVKYVLFEGVELPVPGNADAFLTRTYGDYMKLPSEEQIKKDVHSKELLQENL
jgi:lipopolysaccharide cholinephosphotransferase